MAINKTCLRKIQAVMKLPAIVDVISLTGQVITTAELLLDGSMVDCASKTVYSSPSQLRGLLVASNSGTYKYLRYKGKTLHDWGVER